MGMSETWLKPSIVDSELSIEGYTLFRKDRVSVNKKRGSGVAMFIKNDIKAVSWEELVDNRFQDCLFCSIEC